MCDNGNSEVSLKVLAVDDEPDFLEVLVKRLSKRNLTVVPASSGKAALELLDREEFDAVLLDMNMPGMCGMETLRQIKQLMPSLEVIILTGQAEQQLALQGMETGAFDYLLKPPDLDELVYKIQDASEKALQSKQIQP